MAWVEPTAGELDTPVTLIDLARTTGADGSVSRVETPKSGAANDPIWARVMPASWKQMRAAEQLEQRVTHSVTIRWRPDFAATFGPEARLSFTDRAGVDRRVTVRNVVDPDNMGRWLELACEEGGPR